MNFEAKTSVVWLQGLTCNGNTHSFLNYENFELFKNYFTLLHHPQLPSSLSTEDILQSELNVDILIIEGALSHDSDILASYDGKFNEIFYKLHKKCKYLICAGSCASFGGIFRLHNHEKISGVLYSGQKNGGYLLKSDKIINIPGCPLHPRWLMEVLLSIRTKKKSISLDEWRRPKEIFSYLVHHGCLRNEYFEWKVDTKEYGQKEGCMFYEHGCQGPMSHANCNKILWNNVSSKTRVGTGCLGCTEFDFPRIGLFETKKNMSLPATPYGISKRAYYTVAGVVKSFSIDRLNKRLIEDEDN